MNFILYKMNALSKSIGVLIIVVLLVSATYYVFFTTEDGDAVDSEPPVIQNVTGSFLVNVGETATILTNFSDNVGVVEARLHYKKVGDEIWSSESILEGSANIQIPLNSDESWYYYVTVNDQKGNGPIGEPSVDGSKFYIISVVDDKKELSHKVFLEEGTATWCSNCPDSAKIIENVYNAKDPDFYYVNLVQDKSDKANDRLYDDYNIYGFPTVFFDGGFDTCCIDIMTENRNEALFEQKIAKVASREVPRVYLDLNITWDEDEEELLTTVDVENRDESAYSGVLKVYVTEIVSRWSDWDGNPYHYGFLDYAINEEITVSAGDIKTVSKIWNQKDAGFSNVYPENLWIIAVLFNSESVEKYSDPPNNEYKFDAYFADAATGSRVSNGTLPPRVGISTPQQWMRYIFDKELDKTLTGNTILLGKKTIKIEYIAESGVEKVEFTIKGKFSEKTETITEEPFEWIWDSFAFGKYTITVKLYDKEGRTDPDSIEVFASILGIFKIIS